MKYVYGQRIRTFRDRLTTGVASLAILANSFGVALPFVLAQKAAAATSYSQGFESDTSGWAPNGAGTVTQTPSGSPVSADGSYHATVGGSVFTQFGGYESVFPTNGYTTSLDVYLDPAWVAGSGFDYSVASNGSDGLHQRDFVFHVAKDTSTDSLLVGGSNNSNNATIPENLESGNHYDVTAAGWYTLEHIFYNNGGLLAVDLNLLNSVGTTVFTETRSDAADTIPTEVGGHRYGWFTFNNVPGGLAIDNASLVTIPTAPTLSVNASVYSGADYKGVYTEFTVDHLTDATSVAITVDRATGGPVAKTAKTNVLNLINTGAPAGVSAPIIAEHGTYSEEHSNSWNPAPALWDATTIPEFVTVTITRSGGPDLIETVAITNTAAYSGILPAFACSLDSTTFDNFSNNSVNNQYGWESTGPFDQKIVDNTYGYSSFGCQSLRISNAVTSGSFGNQTFSYSTSNEAGESDSTSGGKSGGTRQNHFEAEFDIASTSANVQPGLALSVSPDRGDGSRMSYLRFEDTATGVEVYFVDVSGTTSPVSFDETLVSTLSRTAPHTIKFVIDYVDGPSNDVVNIYIDGGLVRTGTSWENYYRYDNEASAEQTPRTTDSLLFRAAGTNASATSGNGFLFDNVNLSTSTISPDTTPPAVPTNLLWTPNGGSAMASGGATNVQQGTLNWQDSDTDVDHYKYYFWTNIPGYFEGQANAWFTEGSAYITQSPAGGSIWTDFYDKVGTYYFCVKAIDAVGNTSDCSDTFSVTYDVTAPDMPVHVSPANNGSINVNDFYFQWTDVAGAVEYEFQSSQNPSVNGSGALNSGVWNNKLHGAPDRNNLTASEIHSYGANGTWYWQVRARDAAGNWSGWTSPWKLTIDMVAPQILGVTYNEVPSNDSKDSGDTTYLQDFKFTLSSSSDTVRYQLKYWNDIAGSPFKVGSPWNPIDGSWSGHMGPLGTYTDLFTQGYGLHYFSFSACDAAGNCSEYSSPFEITYTEEEEDEELPQLPAAPQTLGWAVSEQTPVCDITTSATLVAPTWTAVDGASYYIYSYMAPGGSWIVDGTHYTNPTTGNTAFGTTEGVAGLWQFRVQAVLVNGDTVTTSDWSAPCGITFEPEEEGGVTLGASTDLPSGGDQTLTDVLGLATNGQVLAASTNGLAGTGSQTGGIVTLAAATMLGLALLVVRRKQEN